MAGLVSWLTTKTTSTGVDDRTKKPEKPPVRGLLSLDGGGVRGIMQASFLAKVEELAGVPIAELFPCMSSASIGSVQAALLSAKDDNGKMAYTAADIVKFFETEAAKIFPQSVVRNVETADGLLAPKYSAAPFETLIAEKFGTNKFEDLASSQCMASFDVTAAKPKWFTCPKTEIGVAIRASAAAPTLFTAAVNNGHARIDGGIVANTPVVHGYAHAATNEPNYRYIVCSLGTGFVDDKLTVEQASNQGDIKVAENILNNIFDAQREEAHSLMNLLSRKDSVPFYGFNTPITAKDSSMTDTTPANLLRLITYGQNLFEQNRDQVKILIHQLLHEGELPE